jgi:hypothetical protein
MKTRALSSSMAFSAFLISCPGDLPAVDPGAFACMDDAPLKDGTLPCPDSSWCNREECSPRLGCFVPGATRPGCDPDRSCEMRFMGCRRCDARFNTLTDAVICESGVHTSTSVRPKDLDTCACPDGTNCVAAQDAPPTGAYQLYLLPPMTPLPIGKLGFTKENIALRMCVRACSNELDCSADHTCRATAVVSSDLLAHPDSKRHTIGTCYPDRLVSTSSLSSIIQPNPIACDDALECTEMGVPGPCQYRVIEIPDHPTVPAGEGWGEHMAMIAECIGEMTGANFVANDLGCTQGDQCASGVCQTGRCAIPCNPLRAGSCPGVRRCNDVSVSRTLPKGKVLEDRVHVCSPP